MISIKRLQTVYVVAGDMLAATAFYERLFGLVPKFRDGERWTQYDVQGSGFALACRAEGVPDQSGAVPVFEVGDLANVEEAVRDAGGEVAGTRDMGAHGRVLTLRDPAGNHVQLFCRAAQG